MNKAIPKVLAVCGSGGPTLSSQTGGESPLQHLCKAFGYQVATYAVGNLNEMTRTIRFLGAIAHLPKYQAGPLLLHISIGGDSRGMEIGPDKAPWNKLTLTLSNLLADLESYPEPIVLVLAARGATETEFSGLLKLPGDSATRFPRHQFQIVELAPRWVDTMFVWSLFYGEATEIDFTEHSVKDLPNLRRLDARMQQLELGKLSYIGAQVAPRSNRSSGGGANRS